MCLHRRGTPASEHLHGSPCSKAYVLITLEALELDAILQAGLARRRQRRRITSLALLLSFSPSPNSGSGAVG